MLNKDFNIPFLWRVIKKYVITKKKTNAIIKDTFVAIVRVREMSTRKIISIQNIKDERK